MKISRSRYEKARRMLAEVTSYQRTVQTWEEAIKRVGNVGDQTVVAIEITEDGRIKIECETPPVRHVEGAGA